MTKTEIEKETNEAVNDNKSDNTSKNETKNNEKPKSKKKIFIILAIIVVAIIAIVALVFFTSNNTQKTNNSQNTIEEQKIEDDDIERANNYLKDKYNKEFTRSNSKYDKKELFTNYSDVYVWLYYVDEQGLEFLCNATKFSNEDWTIKDNYQCLQFINQIDNTIKSSFNFVDSADSSATGTSKKFNSIEDFYQNYADYNFVVYLKQDEFGELNKDTAIEFSKKIIEIIPFKECSFMYSNIYKETKNGIDYQRHTEPIHIAYQNGEYFEPSMERVKEKADALNKAIDDEIEKSKNNN